MGDSKTLGLYCSSKFPWARENISSKLIHNLGIHPLKGSPALTSILLYVILGLTFRNSTWFSHSICVFCADLRTDSDSYLMQH
jgi:hypothetical protein